MSKALQVVSCSPEHRVLTIAARKIYAGLPEEREKSDASSIETIVDGHDQKKSFRQGNHITHRDGLIQFLNDIMGWYNDEACQSFSDLKLKRQALFSILNEEFGIQASSKGKSKAKEKLDALKGVIRPSLESVDSMTEKLNPSDWAAKLKPLKHALSDSRQYDVMSEGIKKTAPVMEGWLTMMDESGLRFTSRKMLANVNARRRI